MKITIVGLIMLCMFTLAYAATGNQSTAPKSNETTQQKAETVTGQIATPAPAPSSHHAAILSRAEADSMQIRGDSLLANSDTGEIKVGEFGGNDVIYVLVVVLLVVVIIAVIR